MSETRKQIERIGDELTAMVRAADEEEIKRELVMAKVHARRAQMLMDEATGA